MPRRRVWRLDSETEIELDQPARPKPVVSRGDQEKNRGDVGRSVERDDEFFDASTEFDDTSRSRVARKQSRVEQLTPELPVGLLWRPLKILAVLIDDRETVRVSFQTPVFAALTPGE